MSGNAPQRASCAGAASRLSQSRGIKQHEVGRRLAAEGNPVDDLPGIPGLRAKDGRQTEEPADRPGRGALPAPNQ